VRRESPDSIKGEREGGAELHRKIITDEKERERNTAVSLMSQGRKKGGNCT